MRFLNHEKYLYASKNSEKNNKDGLGHEKPKQNI
jgi:hypothetical protein